MSVLYHCREHEGQAQDGSLPGNYMKRGSLNVTESRDLFLYKTFTRTAKPKNNSSSGSSMHTSSSGSTHGGGGGKF